MPPFGSAVTRSSVRSRCTSSPSRFRSSGPIGRSRTVQTPCGTGGSACVCGADAAAGASCTWKPVPCGQPARLRCAGQLPGSRLQRRAAAGEAAKQTTQQAAVGVGLQGEVHPVEVDDEAEQREVQRREVEVQDVADPVGALDAASRLRVRLERLHVGRERRAGHVRALGGRVRGDDVAIATRWLPRTTNF